MDQFVVQVREGPICIDPERCQCGENLLVEGFFYNSQFAFGKIADFFYADILFGQFIQKFIIVLVLHSDILAVFLGDGRQLFNGAHIGFAVRDMIAEFELVL
ncbi:hypothetical protein SDC9_122421 [bioreactor metagenome]|uniref:Uncharacterized protein n=1 Tax=bioreactor metagenome TaxID=1076179 RepID=A0A645CEU4_9ZZZZ